MELDAQTLSILSGVLVPILVGIVTRLDATAGLKAVLNFGLSAVSGALTAVTQNSGQLVWREFVTSIGVTWVVSVATYYGLYKPSGVAGTVAASTAGFGIGNPPAPTMETDEKGVEDLGEAIAAQEAAVQQDLLGMQSEQPVQPADSPDEEGPHDPVPAAKAAPRKAAARRKTKE